VSVLLVEDDPLIREFVVEALRDAGYHVIHASTGEEALDWCKRHVADVLVTDVRLPGNIDGWQIAERCRESDPELPVIYATGYSPAAPRPVPGSRIVKKPFHPDEVVRMVRELGGQKGCRRTKSVPQASTAELPHHLRSGSLAGGPLLFPGKPLMLEGSCCWTVGFC
jgi:CheY-like chemotaxis protein